MKIPHRRSFLASIDTSTNRMVGSPIAVEEEPRGIAVTPDGREVYVTNAGSSSVSVIDAANGHRRRRLFDLSDPRRLDHLVQGIGACADDRNRAGRPPGVRVRCPRKAKPHGWPAFRKKLAFAKRVLVKRTLIVGGARRTVFAKLKIVQ